MHSVPKSWGWGKVRQNSYLNIQILEYSIQILSKLLAKQTKYMMRETLGPVDARVEGWDFGDGLFLPPHFVERKNGKWMLRADSSEW